MSLEVDTKRVKGRLCCALAFLKTVNTLCEIFLIGTSRAEAILSSTEQKKDGEPGEEERKDLA